MFEKWRKTPRLNKEVVVTEKIDGTNAQIHIVHNDDEVWNTLDQRDVVAQLDDLTMFVGSRSRYITPDDDNFGFAQWCRDNAEDLFRFGTGRHYGEWWGCGIQRGYEQESRRLSMFNPKWGSEGPDCVDSVPVLGVLTGFDAALIDTIWYDLRTKGSVAAPGFMDPEGIIVFHSGSNQVYKRTYEFDEGKWNA